MGLLKKKLTERKILHEWRYTDDVDFEGGSFEHLKLDVQGQGVEEF